MKKLVVATAGILLAVLIMARCAEAQSPKKCLYPPKAQMNIGVIMEDGHEEYVASFTLIVPLPIVITVLEETTMPTLDENGKEIEQKVYRFNGEYDQPPIVCPSQIPHILLFDEYKHIVPENSMDRFYMFVDQALQCK